MFYNKFCKKKFKIFHKFFQLRAYSALTVEKSQILMTPPRKSVKKATKPLYGKTEILYIAAATGAQNLIFCHFQAKYPFLNPSFSVISTKMLLSC